MRDRRDIEIIGGGPEVPRNALIGTIVEYLRGTRVRRAILFGSSARGSADALSDVDLLLVEETAQPFTQRGLAHLPLFRLGVAVDLLVYTPDEFLRMRDQNGPFYERIDREGVTIYERSET